MRKNLPTFTERFKPGEKGLVSEDRNKEYTSDDYFRKQIQQLDELLQSVRSNVQPEFDPTFTPKIYFVSIDVTEIKYDERMFQFVVYNASSVGLNVGILGQLGLPYQITVATNKIFVSPVYAFEKLNVSLTGTPATFAIPIVFGYNRIMFTPGQFSL